MKSKGLLTASILLLLLSGFVWWSNKKTATPDKKPAEGTTTKLLNVTEEQIQALEIKKRSGESIRLLRSDSMWQIAAPKALRADPDAVSSILSALASLSSDRTVEEKVASLEQYGLAQPAIELSITDKTGKTAKLLFGDDTPAGTAAYAAIGGDPRVYALSSYKKSSFDKPLDDFRNKKLFDFGFAPPDKIEIQDGGKRYLLTRADNDWSSNGAKMDASSVSTLVDKIRSLSASKFVETGIAAAAIDITVVSESGKRVEKVMFSKNATKYVAKRENEPALYELDAAGVTEVQKSAAAVVSASLRNNN
jgi:hypothetical protein